LAIQLERDISEFRDKQITHLNSQRTVRGTSSDGRMTLSQIYPSEKDEQKESKLMVVPIVKTKSDQFSEKSRSSRE
jgi:hypothetical protein